MIGWNRRRNNRDNGDAGDNREDDARQDGNGGELVPFRRRSAEPGQDRTAGSDGTNSRTVPSDGRDRPDHGPEDGPETGSEDGPETGSEDGPGRALVRSGDGYGSGISKVEDGEVLEGEIVPVDGPHVRDSDWLTELHARREQRHPVIPVWLRSWEQATATGKWVVGFAAHVVAYHLVRTPLYGLKLGLRSPVGGFRLVGRVMRWWWDLDGEQVRLATVTPKPDPETYLRLARHRDARVRGRTILLVAGLVAATCGGVWGWLAAPEWSRWPALAVLVVVLGLGGARADRPLVSPAVVPTRVQRLSAELVTRALGSLGNAEINKALAKGGDGISFPAPISRDGPGWRAEVDLPYGVTVADIAERRDRLASGLRRPVGCVWPEPAAEVHAGRLVLWVGDQDLAKARQPSWPLARTGRVDLFAAVPFGTDQRGRTVVMELMYGNVLIGAMPGMGKTFALRILALAAALDARAELRTFELKGSGDLSALEKVSHTYGSGIDDDTIAACVDTLRDVANVEIPRRAKVIAGLPKDICPDNKVTRDLADTRRLGLHPLVVIVDECQNLFSHSVFGKEAGDLCEKIIKLGRAFGVILKLATQRPDAPSLPTGVSSNAGIRFCLRVMGQTENDMVLGTSSYKNGTRATMFTARDLGIGYLVGTRADAQIVRSYKVDNPAADKICDRARALRAAAGTLTGHAIGDTTTGATAGYDLLGDVLAVIGAGEDKVWSETVVERLAELRPDVYTGWSGEQLAAALKPHAVPTGRQVWGKTPDGKGANRRGIHRDDLTKALTERDRKRGESRG